MEPAQRVARALQTLMRGLQDPVGGPGLPPEDVAAYALLQKTMAALLSESTLVSVRGTNVVHVRTFIIGRVDDGNVAGLRTVSIET